MKRMTYAVAIALLWPMAAPAQTNAQQMETWINPRTPEQTEAQWNGRRFAEARPVPLQRAALVTPREEEFRSATGTSEDVLPGAPRRQPRRVDQPLFDAHDAALVQAAAPAEPAKGVFDNNVGTAKAHYSSSRLIPLTADLEYPYRTVGKLFFDTADGEAECSAALIARRLVLTAGHCVHAGTAEGFYDNFVFVPAYRDGVAPFGVWVVNAILVPTTWAGGGGKVPNAADYAVLELADNQLGKAGEALGWLGVLTKKLLPNHVLMLGYPGNLDQGEKMHQVSAESFKANAATTVVYGSDMGPGSSGGPWVQNFGVAAAGQTGGTNSAPNRIVGVTSYVATAPAVKVSGSSILDQRFTQMYNTLCANRPGNC